ncbi:MAG: tRNA1(Val) (adenine(37)-N6)-methyltransferase [Faecalibacterium sp.]|nr:tRNA1(Val) (adenine(37)-N6)-methyltransferase [Ruminococcus sp.]MCM1392000.1 tRNA1(Val) (adenine(37)-N6)-methyltransferase [Ruminococcus sp.]MCM1485569.1 tRNA1(Val) (adenine(37)-N6)-methyltransferase [Faecalibacterium sp.]
MSIELTESERLEPLGNNMEIVVSDDHTFGTDAVLLAAFANIRKKDKACDMGTGCGIIPLIWCKGEVNNITAVDIQKKACSQAQKSVELNALKEKMTVVNADIRSLKGVLDLGTYDLVTMNPPYKPVGTGIESISDADKIARHETMCTIDDAVAAAASLLKFGGRFCMCHRPERLCDIICSMRNGKIEVKRIRFVVQSEGKAPWLVLVEGKRGAKSSVTVEKNLVMKNSDGSNTDEFRAMFGDYMDGHQ